MHSCFAAGFGVKKYGIAHETEELDPFDSDRDGEQWITEYNSDTLINAFHIQSEEL